MTVVTEGKKCPYCDKKLRADNTRGACSKCLAKGADKKAARQVDEAPPVAEKKAPKGKLVEPDREVVIERVDRFLQLSTLLGVDGAGLLVEFIDGWVGQVRAKAKSIVEEA